MNLPLLNVWKMNNLNYEKVFETLVRETKDYLHSNSLHAMVLGISGGIDSTVEDVNKAVAEICKERGWYIPEEDYGEGAISPQIPKKSMGEVIKLVKTQLNNVDGKLLADTVKTYLV